MSSNVVIVDNGAHTIKAGLSNTSASPRCIYNAAIRSKGDRHLYIGHEFEKCRDYASLNYRLSFEKGYLTDWDVQKAVWDNLFGPDMLSLDLQSTSLLITEPVFNFHSIQEKYDQLAFEEYEFASYLRCPVGFLAPYGSLFSLETTKSSPYPECSLIVDSGFSFTHVIPIMQGKVLWNGVRRIDVGGKFLTNHLSTLVSFRQWNMLDQTHIVNEIKESCCYVSSSFSSDLERCRMGGIPNGITVEYVLPDFSRNRHGYVRSESQATVFSRGNRGDDAMQTESDLITRLESDGQPGKVLEADEDDKNKGHQKHPPPSDSDQILYMSNERFTVPELIFNPSDIGLAQAGLAQTIFDSISCLPQDLQGMFWANIGLIGGNTKFKGFGNRLRQELRALAPVEFEVGVYESKEPIIETYKAAHALANSVDYSSLVVTREEYNEGGSNACRKKFRDFDWDPIKLKTAQVSRSARRDKGECKVVEESDGEESESETKKPTKKIASRKREKTIGTRSKRDVLRH